MAPPHSFRAVVCTGQRIADRTAASSNVPQRRPSRHPRKPRIAHSRLAITALSLLLAGTTLATADDITITRSADPVIHSYPERAIDILGIRPGMTAERVREILREEYGGETTEEQTSIVFRHNSIEVRSRPYLSVLAAAKGEDRIKVVFGSPGTGGTVVAVTRTLTFSDPLSAPRIDAIRAQLEGKYGPRSHAGGGTRSAWVYDASAQVRCANNACPLAYGSFSPSNARPYQQSVARGQHLIIQADLYGHRDDPSRARTLKVTVDDQAGKVRTLDEAFRQGRAAAIATYERSAMPRQAPKL